MTLIKSISGIRGIVGSGFTPDEIVKFTVAYCRVLSDLSAKEKLKVVIGRDARTSGEMIRQIVSGTLMACGADVIDLGLATTPTVEMAVIASGSDGGIILTASHNPAEWNALKLLNNRGEFLSSSDGLKLLEFVEKDDYSFPGHGQIGTYCKEEYLEEHIRKILELPLVNVQAIRDKGFRVAYDAVNSVGAIAVPELLKALGITQVVALNAIPDGNFAHNPEPLPEHLQEISHTVKSSNSDVGFAVDPDVDRLAIINEDGSFFGEEYTLVAVADYILKHNPGNTVSNLSSSRALKDVTEQHGGQYFAAAVGEVNVVEKMKQCNAVIGGEGNGGVIYPGLHHGRDALVGIALFLSHLAEAGTTCSQLRNSYPAYFISKNKATLKENADILQVFSVVREAFPGYPVNDADGIKLDFEEGWVHLRSSNTEPIIRIYSEGRTSEQAEHYAGLVLKTISAYIC